MLSRQPSVVGGVPLSLSCGLASPCLARSPQQSQVPRPSRMDPAGLLDLSQRLFVRKELLLQLGSNAELNARTHARKPCGSLLTAVLLLLGVCVPLSAANRLRENCQKGPTTKTPLTFFWQRESRVEKARRFLYRRERKHLGANHSRFIYAKCVIVQLRILTGSSSDATKREIELCRGSLTLSFDWSFSRGSWQCWTRIGPKE